MKNRALLVALLLASGLLSGCSSQASKTYLYTLHASSNIQNISDLSFEGDLGVGPIVLPESLTHAGVVLYAEGNQVLTSASNMWAGDLKKAISRVIASNISTATKKDNIWSFPWDVRTRPKTQVSLIVERLGGGLGGDVEMLAKWKILGEEGSKVLSVGRCQFNDRAIDASYNAYVASINALIGNCSQKILQALNQ